MFDLYFEKKMQGKAYKSEQEYMADAYAFLDFCLAMAAMLLIEQQDCGDGEAQKVRRHIRQLPGSLDDAYASVSRSRKEMDIKDKELVKEQLLYAKQYIRERLVYTPFMGSKFRLRQFFGIMRLTEYEQFLVLLGYAGTYDVKYNQIFADLQGLENANRPTLKLLEFLYSLYGEIGEIPFGELQQRQNFLLDCFCEVKRESWMTSENFSFILTRRMCSYLEGYEELDREVKKYAKLYKKEDVRQEVYIRQEEMGRIQRNIAHFLGEAEKFPQKGSCGNVLHIFGVRGNGRRLSVQRAAALAGYDTIVADITTLSVGTVEEIQSSVAALLQESILLHACVCFIDDENREETEDDEQRQTAKFPKSLDVLLHLLAARMPFFVWISEEKSQYLLKYGFRLVCEEQPMLTVGERIVLWKEFAKDYELSERVDLILCANQYILSVQGILSVLQTAEFIRIGCGDEMLEPEHIRDAVKQQSPNQLGRFATLVPAVYTWDDLVVSEEQKHQMHLICNQLKYRNVVGEDWGFFKKTAYGRGVCALFYGSPGTGKTMAVQVMANELGLDLYRVDLSQLVSKYIGETEKNISTLFRKAKNINALLFFDEADSLFAKRSEVKDSHDRNANAETAHLLQKLEDYEGITILATNYVNNIDDAFKRRIKFMINFSFPTPDVRLMLWNTILPKSVPCGEELDFEYYAEQFELSGSSIKEILTNAAYIAASQKEELKNVHLIEAIKLNFAKYGKILTDDDFGYLIEK